MSLADSPARPMTAEALLALPDDGMERELIRGQLREKPMTRRNPAHSEIEISVGYLLRLWLDQQPRPRGKVHGGEAAFRLRREPDSFVGIDVAYASAELVARTAKGVSYYDGPPVLAVEIISPSDKHEDIVEKVELYLEVGTIVWVIDPDLRIVTVCRPGRVPEGLNTEQELSGEPELPGFRVAVASILES
jgi:Uma2 family endonuclease